MRDPSALDPRAWSGLLLVIAAVASLVASGCGLGRLVRPNEPLALGSDTLFVLAVRSTEYVTLTFCRDADYASCLTTGMLPREGPPLLYAVPPGRYCLLDVLVEPETGGSGSVHVQVDPARAMCFVARPDAIAYPGDLMIDARPAGEGIMWSVVPRWTSRDDIDARVYTQYPNLQAGPIEDAPLARYVP